MQYGNARIPSGMLRSGETQYPHPTRIPSGTRPNTHTAASLQNANTVAAVFHATERNIPDGMWLKKEILKTTKIIMR